MGWASGSELMSKLIDAVKSRVDEKTRKVLYEGFIEAFVDMDCDTLYECQGEDPVFDLVFSQGYNDDAD